MTIEFTKKTIYPLEAATILATRNPENRTIRSATVNTYARDMKEGKWKETHQCIAFNEQGSLIDGQHRLSAIVKADVALSMYVAKYVGEGTALHIPIDQQIRRTAADVIGCSRREQETATAILALSSGSLKGVSSSEVETTIHAFGRLMGAVHSVIRSNVRHRTSARARAAIVILASSLPEYEDVILDQYRKFASLEFDGMWSSVKALVKLFDLTHVPTGTAGGTFVAHRVYYAFHPEHSDVKIIRILNPAELSRELMVKATDVLQNCG